MPGRSINGWWVVLLAAASCGRYGYDPLESGALCSPWTGEWTLEPPERFDVLDDSTPISNLYLTDRGLTMYFDAPLSGDAAQNDVYRVTRSSTDEAFGAPEPVPGINTDDNEYGIVVAPGGTEAWFASDRAGGRGGVDFWAASRSSPAEPFGGVQPMDALNTTRNDFDLFLAADGLRLYASIVPTPGSSQELIVTTRPALGLPFADPPILLDELNGADADADPTLDGDERVLVFTSDRPGGFGQHDLWYAVRADRDAPFSEPRPLPVINSDGEEGESALSHDGCELLFLSNRAGDGVSHLYRTRFVRAE